MSNRAVRPPSTRFLAAYWIAIAAVHGGLSSLYRSRAGYKLLSELGIITHISLHSANGLSYHFVLVVAFALLMFLIHTRA